MLRALYADVADEAIDLSTSTEWPVAVANFIEAGVRQKDAKKIYNEARNRVAALLGNYRRGYGAGYQVNTAISKETPDRPARPGEIIRGHVEARRYIAKQQEEKAA